jgi:hypothetical protein
MTGASPPPAPEGTSGHLSHPAPGPPSILAGRRRLPDEQRADSLPLPSSPGFPVLRGRRGTRCPADGKDNPEDGRSHWPLQDAPGPRSTVAVASSAPGRASSQPRRDGRRSTASDAGSGSDRRSAWSARRRSRPWRWGSVTGRRRSERKNSLDHQDSRRRVPGGRRQDKLC